MPDVAGGGRIGVGEMIDACSVLWQCDLWISTQPRSIMATSLIDYPITIDYAQTLDEMIAAGQYDYVNDRLTASCFPIRGSGTQAFTLELVSFGGAVSSEMATERILRAFRCAKIEHLLALGAQFPNLQREFPIVCLGSFGRVDGYRTIAFLSRRGEGRKLDLTHWSRSWNESCRFLVLPPS